MKKFAFLAMLLGSSFLYGCGPAPSTTDKPKDTTTTGTTEPAKDGTATPDKPADTTEKPAEPAK